MGRVSLEQGLSRRQRAATALVATSRTPIAISLGGKGAEIVTLFALVILLPRALGPSDYGRFAVAASVVAIVSASLGLGGPTMLSRFVPTAEGDARRRLARALAGRLLLVRALQVGVIAVSASVLVVAFPDSFALAATILVVVAISFEAVASLGYQVVLGLGRTTLWSFKFPIQNAIVCIAALVLYRLYGATGAIGGITVAAGAAFLLGGGTAFRELRGVRPAAALPQGALRFASIQTVSGLLVQLSHRGSPVAVLLIAGSEDEAGFVALAAGVALTATYVVAQVFVVELPRLAATFEQSPHEVERQAQKLAAIASVVLVPIGILAVVVVEAGLPVALGQDFAAAIPAFGPALAILPLAPLSALGAQMAALRLRPELSALANGAGAAAFVIAVLVAAPSWAAVGGTIALLVATVVSILATLVLMPDALGRRLTLVAFGASALVLVVAAAL